MKALPLLLLLAFAARAQPYTYTVGQNLRWDESRQLNAGESLHIPAGVVAYSDFQVLGPGVKIVNDGTWTPSQSALEQGAELRNNGQLRATFLHLFDGTLRNAGTATFQDLPVEGPGRVVNTGSLAVTGTYTNAGTLQNCGTLTTHAYVAKPGSAALPCAPLPVVLTTFTARLAMGTVVLEWTTAQEVNTARYEVQRSPDGQLFNYVAQQPARGAGAYQQAAKVPGPGLSYWRLRIVDVDGTDAYSPVAVVDAGGPVAVAYYNEAGQRVARPAHGFCLEVSTLAGGAVVSRKYWQE